MTGITLLNFDAIYRFTLSQQNSGALFPSEIVLCRQWLSGGKTVAKMPVQYRQALLHGHICAWYKEGGGVQYM